MPIYEYKIHLTLQGPVLSQRSGSREHGIDTAVLRDEAENPALPGSLIRGNLRQVWKMFNQDYPHSGCPDQTQIDAWLGQPSPESSSDEPMRAKLFFSHQWVSVVKKKEEKGNEEEKEEEKEKIQHRIKIDTDTGTVEQGALQVIETPFLSGESVIFSGSIRAHLDDATEAKILQKWLCKGLNYISSLGALKGVGFGRLLKVTVSDAILAQTLPTQKLSSTGRFGICLKLDRPFCFARHHSADDNRFESEDFIPGAAIRGVLAKVFYGKNKTKYKKLEDNFSKVYITHAQPVCDLDEIPKRNTRPFAIPLSFVTVKDDKNNLHLYDVATCENPGLIHGKAPTFQPDWKSTDWGKANTFCHRSALPERQIEVHTAIDYDTNTAKESALFSLETVSPYTFDDGKNNYRWLANVDCSQANKADREEVLTQLQELLSQGLDDLGKTKAHAEVSLHSEPYPYSVVCNEKVETGQSLILVLQSAARLLPKPYDIAPSNDGKTLKKSYRAVWKTLSGDSLELSYFYAQQQLVGGQYLWQRFWKDRKTYNPELLTVTGSVFVFEVRNAEVAQKHLNAWLARGLPQHPDALDGDDWKKNPFMAANGYGEIAINPQWAMDLSVQDAIWSNLDEQR